MIDTETQKCVVRCGNISIMTSRATDHAVGDDETRCEQMTGKEAMWMARVHHQCLILFHG